jgi:hypothetical protein
MAMVDRYKKSGGFVQLIQVIETCNPKKREQFMNIISEESPIWAEALNQKSLSFDKIVNWKADVLLDVVASVNSLAFSAALKSLSPETLAMFVEKLTHQERRKFETYLAEANPNPNEIASSVLKVVSETRMLMVQGTLKADKIDLNLVIPEEFESMLEKGEQRQAGSIAIEATQTGFNAGAANSSADIDKLQKKVVLLSKELQTLKQENLVMKDKLDKIKKIA